MIQHGTKLHSILFPADMDGSVMICEVNRNHVVEIEVFMVEAAPWAAVRTLSSSPTMCYNLGLVLGVEVL
jgi:hypothetical protein